MPGSKARQARRDGAKSAPKPSAATAAAAIATASAGAGVATGAGAVGGGAKSKATLLGTKPAAKPAAGGDGGAAAAVQSPIPVLPLTFDRSGELIDPRPSPSQQTSAINQVIGVNSTLSADHRLPIAIIETIITPFLADPFGWFRDWMSTPVAEWPKSKRATTVPKSIAQWEVPLSAAELDALEAEHGFTFTAPHRTFLQTVYAGMPPRMTLPKNVFAADPNQLLPLNWRNADTIANRMEWCFTGFKSDVEAGRMWRKSWGVKPAEPAQRLAQFRKVMDAAPRAIPVHAHRFAFSAEAKCSAIMSVYGFDIVPYGASLPHYLEQEFGANAPTKPHPVLWYVDDCDHFGSRAKPAQSKNAQTVVDADASVNVALRDVPFWGELIYGEYQHPEEEPDIEDPATDSAYD